MSDALEELLEARRTGRPCALATVAATKGSVAPRPGAKMIVYDDGSISGTVGGGKFKSLVIASRHYDIDRAALAAALKTGGIGYIGMIGSRRKVLRVYDQVKAERVTAEQLATVHAPLGLDIGSDSRVEITVCVLAEILMVLRGKSGRPLKL